MGVVVGVGWGCGGLVVGVGWWLGGGTCRVT